MRSEATRWSNKALLMHCGAIPYPQNLWIILWTIGPARLDIRGHNCIFVSLVKK